MATALTKNQKRGALVVKDSKVSLKGDGEFSAYRRLQATSYGAIGNRRGESSYLDKDLIAENMEKQQRRLGKGVLRLAYINEKGDPDPDAIIEKNGRIFRPNPKGVFSQVDEGYLQFISKQRREQEEYVEKILSAMVDADDYEASNILQLPYDEFKTMCEEGGGGDIGLPPACAKYNCLPSYLDYLASNDPLYYGGMAKLRSIVKAFLPVIISNSETHTFEMANKKE